MPRARRAEDFTLPDIIKGVRIPQTHPEWDALTEEQLLTLLAAGIKGAESWWAARQASKNLQAKIDRWNKAEEVKRQRAANIAKAAKVAHVKRAGQTRDHVCHWPGCPEQVPPAVWGCKRHWFMLPKSLRAKVWSAYRPGQEVNGTPSRRYVEVAREVQQWIRDNHPVPPDLRMSKDQWLEAPIPDAQSPLDIPISASVDAFEPTISDDPLPIANATTLPAKEWIDWQEPPRTMFTEAVIQLAEEVAEAVGEIPPYEFVDDGEVPDQSRERIITKERDFLNRYGGSSIIPPFQASPIPPPVSTPSGLSSQRNGAASPLPGTVIAREMLAINMADRERLEESVRVRVAKIVDAAKPVWMDKNREDERAVVFTCDLLMAAMACDVCREADLQAKRERTRVYVRKGAWSKLPGTTRLTVVVAGKVRLNPAVFNVEVVPIRMAAPKAKRFL